MPQLSPMMGFMISLFVLASFLIFMSGMSKVPAKVSQTKFKATKKSAFSLFKLWNGSKMPKL